jgi:hypothetical protein
MSSAAWNEYRGWAKRARALQRNSLHWNTAALTGAGCTAILGAAASQAGASPTLSRSLSLAAGVAAALTAVLGKEILSTGSEAKWVRARATAEAIKSECFRFAARIGDYASDGALDAFLAKRAALIQLATDAELTPIEDPVPQGGDERQPSIPLDAKWYLDHRVDDQINQYLKRKQDHEKTANRLWYLGFAAAAAAAVFGVIGTVGQEWFAPWIAAMTTVAAAIAAYGQLDRRQHLTANYDATAASLRRLNERFADGRLELSALVAAVEDLLGREHAAWNQLVTQAAAAPAKPAAAAGPKKDA